MIYSGNITISRFLKVIEVCVDLYFAVNVLLPPVSPVSLNVLDTDAPSLLILKNPIDIPFVSFAARIVAPLTANDIQPTSAVLLGSDILQDILMSTESPVVMVTEGPAVAKSV